MEAWPVASIVSHLNFYLNKYPQPFNFCVIKPDFFLLVDLQILLL